MCWSDWYQVWMCETYFDRYICQNPTVPLHPQTNISVSRVLHNSLHFPIKVYLSELRWTNLFGGIMSLTGQFDTIMDMWDKFWQVYVKNHDAPFEVCHFKYIWFCQFIFLINCLGMKVINYPQHSRPGLVNADRPFVCQSVWNSWNGEYFEQQHSFNCWSLTFDHGYNSWMGWYVCAQHLVVCPWSFLDSGKR